MITEEEIEAEIGWLRQIDMGDEKDIRRAAKEILESVKGGGN